MGHQISLRGARAKTPRCCARPRVHPPMDAPLRTASRAGRAWLLRTARRSAICLTRAAGTAGVAEGQASASVFRAFSDPTAAFRTRARDTAIANRTLLGRVCAIRAGGAPCAISLNMIHVMIASRAAKTRGRVAAKNRVTCLWTAVGMGVAAEGPGSASAIRASRVPTAAFRRSRAAYTTACHPVGRTASRTTALRSATCLSRAPDTAGAEEAPGFACATQVGAGLHAISKTAPWAFLETALAITAGESQVVMLQAGVMRLAIRFAETESLSPLKSATTATS